MQVLPLFAQADGVKLRTARPRRAGGLRLISPGMDQPSTTGFDLYRERGARIRPGHLT